MISVDPIARIINALAAEGLEACRASDLQNAGATAGGDGGEFESNGVLKMTSDREWEDVLSVKLDELETKQSQVERVLCERFGNREHTQEERAAVYQLVDLRHQLVEAESTLLDLGAAEGNHRIVMLYSDGTNAILPGYFTEADANARALTWKHGGIYVAEDRAIDP